MSLNKKYKKYQELIEVKKLSKRVWSIRHKHPQSPFSYIIYHEKQVFLIDTGVGQGNYKDMVKVEL